LNNEKIYYADDFLYDSMINSLICTERTIQTPHIAGNCVESREATDIYIAKQLVKYIKGEH
jgi:phosphoglycerate dehydrogenase-like enzyme